MEVLLETPEYDLTILRIRFGRRTLKIYTKGERVLRIEAMAHNARELRCRLGVYYLAEAAAALPAMVDRFVEVLDWPDSAFIEAGLLDDLSQPGQLGASHVGGIDLNRPRARAVMQAVLALSPAATGFASSDLARKVRELLRDETYSPSKAAYDLRKLRCKGLVSRIARSRRYHAGPEGLRAMAAILTLRDEVIRPVFAAASRTEPAPQRSVTTELDLRYRRIQQEMQGLFTTLGIAA